MDDIGIFIGLESGAFVGLGGSFGGMWIISFLVCTPLLFASYISIKKGSSLTATGAFLMELFLFIEPSGVEVLDLDDLCDPVGDWLVDLEGDCKPNLLVFYYMNKKSLLDFNYCKK